MNVICHAQLSFTIFGASVVAIAVVAAVVAGSIVAVGIVAADIVVAGSVAAGSVAAVAAVVAVVVVDDEVEVFASNNCCGLQNRFYECSGYFRASVSSVHVFVCACGHACLHLRACRQVCVCVCERERERERERE